MTIVLTNDDGYQSPGLDALRNAFLAAGEKVVVVAPDGPRSGGSRGATFRRPVNIRVVEGDDASRIYACDGTPVDCVRVALLSDLIADVGLVISGINEGANLGDHTTYSSTVGAAWESALLGVPAIALSQQSTDGRFRLVDKTGYDWTWSVAAGVALAKLVRKADLPHRSVVNLNAPGTLRDETVAVTRLGQRVWRRGGLVLEQPDEHGEGYYGVGVKNDADPHFESAPGADFAAIEAGQISLAPMSLNWGDPLSLDELTNWTNRATAQVATTLFASARQAAPR